MIFNFTDLEKKKKDRDGEFVCTIPGKKSQQ